MDSTELILKLINEKYKSIRQFSIAADIPYSTVKSGLKAGIKGMAVETVIKMCTALDIQMDTLTISDSSSKKGNSQLSADEYYLVERYRSLSNQSKQEIMRYIEYRHNTDNVETQKNQKFK
jgi:hypothetical protein